MGTCGGQGKGSSQNLGSSWPRGSGKIPAGGLCCFLHPNSCLHPHSMGFLLFQSESNPHELSHSSEKV